MSRRKQARPRSCKRSGEEDEDVEGEMEPVLEEEKLEEEPVSKRLCVAENGEQDDIDIKLSHNSDVEGVVNGNRSDSGDTGEFHCDTCGSLFRNLEQFMDHRNFECVPEYEGENHPWTIDNLAVNMGPPESPLSSEFLGDSPLSALDCPLSPASENMTPDQVPSGVGVSDINPYGCQFCEKAFPKLSYLKIHEQVHSDQLPFKCAFCSRLFRHKRSRDRHVKLHTGDKKYKCSQCDSAFARSDHLKSHLKTHENGKPFQCTICNRGYQTAAGLTSHVMTHKKGSELNISDVQCHICKEVFSSLAEVQSHMSVHREENVTGKSTVQCPYCGDISPSQDALKLHVEQMHMADQLTSCPICQKSCLSTDDLVHHMTTHDLLAVDRIPTDDHDLSTSTTGVTSNHTLSSQPLVSEMLVCPYCFSSDYDSLEILEIHMQSVHSVKPTEVYTCNYCNAPYQNLYSLHEHMRAVHQNQPCMDIKYPCTHCSRQFSSIENLQQHKKLIHYYERRERRESSDSLYCIMCSMSFQSAGALQEHMSMMHHSSPKSEPKYSNTKSHSSSTGSKRRSSLMNHGSDTGYHKQSENDKSFNRRGINMPIRFSSSPDPHKDRMPTSSPFQEQITCDHCNATFHDRKNFQAHIKLHLESITGGQYCCKLCKQQFPTEDQLEKHSSTHYLSMTTEYGCTSCVKFFSKPDELQKHLMDIHAHHLYRCSLCKEIFDSKVNVQVHFAIKHSNECKLYKCTKCDSVFRSEMEWQVHVRVNHLHVAKPYRCLFCKESFSSEMDLQCHLTTHNKPFRCPMCDESFHVEYLLDKHMQNIHGNPTDKGIPPPPPQMSPVKIKVERDVDTPGFNDRTPPHPSPRFSPKNLNGPGIWKSSELLHTCNICDMKFEQQALLQAHKAVDHGLSAKKSSTSSASVSPDQTSVMKSEPEHQPIRKPVFPAAPVPSLASVAPTVPAVSMASVASITSTAMSLQERLQADAPVPPPTNSHSPVASKSMSLPVVVISEKLSLACMYCSQTFKSRGDLDKHMKIHQNNGSQKCNICDQVFPTSSILAEHKLTHCKIVQGNSCVLCKIPLKNEDQFYVHTQEHGFQGTFMQCLICRQTLASMVELQMHGKHHFQVKSSFYTCCVCLKTFNSKENLVSKMNSSGRTYYVCKPCYHGEHSEYVCSECGASFPTNGELDTHIGTHKKSYQCIKCQESFNSEYEIQLHVATHMMTEGNVHDCKLCSRTFESPAKLQCHLIDHTYRNSEFRCSVCCKIFASAVEIQSHAVEHGPGARRYGCSQCNQKFFFSAELENHAFMHTARENSTSLNSDLTCTECNKTFSNSVNLNNHKKIHEHNENSFKCTLCSEAFHSMGALQGHFYSRHSELDKQTYRCQECDKEFPSLSNLQSHLRIHRLGKENRKTHLRPHPGGKPFLCPVCGKSFARKIQIKEHMRVHFAQDSSQLADMHSFLDMDMNSDSASITSEDNGHDPASDVSFTEQDGGLPGDNNNTSLTSNDVNNHVDGGRQKEQSAVY
ncbi:zinc finger protein 423-like [Argopecten irradians]|uniref:zinc finger protein 423-like n=1 Tax=Argopecten irradians TaxID=31199 RepID=UPI00371819B6